MCIWTVRLYMMMLMHMQGIEKVRVDRSCSIRAFLGMNPDHSKHLSKLYRSNVSTVHSVRDFLALCGWEHSRPELLSMMTCFAGDRGLKESDFDDAKFSQWCVHRNRLERTLGFAPHCVHVAKVVREG